MNFMNCQTETQSSPKLIFKDCPTCNGTGKAWRGTGTNTTAAWGAEQFCFCCLGGGRIIDLDATMRGVTDDVQTR